MRHYEVASYRYRLTAVFVMWAHLFIGDICFALVMAGVFH